MRALKFFLPCIAAAVLAGCAGYRLGPVNGEIAGEKSVDIQPFRNLTLQPRLGDSLTQSLRERVQSDATYRLVTHGDADVVVTGVIQSYARAAMGYLNSDVTTPENYRVDLLVHVTARERLTGKLILDKDVKGHTFVQIGNDLASAEREAMPLLTQDVARNIAEMLTEGTW
jgi:hypothetical protein